MLVTGKGGVGKSTVASAIALVAAQRGKKTLLVSMDGKEPVVATTANLDTLVFTTEEALREYIALYVKIPFVSRLGLLAQTLDFVADAAPGVKEILAVGKVCHEARTGLHDVVVVDAESSGHFVSQVSTPRTIRSLAQVGMLREQTDWMIAMLSDPSVTATVVVTTPEESPVDETIGLVSAIRERANVDVPAVVVNRMPAVAPTSGDDIAPRVVSTLRRRHAIAAGEVGRLVGGLAAGTDVVVAPVLRTNDAVETVVALAASLDLEFGEAL